MTKGQGKSSITTGYKISKNTSLIINEANHLQLCRFYVVECRQPQICLKQILSNLVCKDKQVSRVAIKHVFGLPTRSYTNRAVQPPKMASDLGRKRDYTDDVAKIKAQFDCAVTAQLMCAKRFLTCKKQFFSWHCTSISCKQDLGAGPCEKNVYLLVEEKISSFLFHCFIFSYVH